MGKEYTHIKDFYNEACNLYCDESHSWINGGRDNETQYKLIHNKIDKTLYIIFQSSHMNQVNKKKLLPVDWVSNFMFFPVFRKPYNNMKDVVFRVHIGFIRLWREIKDDIGNYIKENRLDIDHVRIFGWSLGGAFSQLCHEYCFFNFKNVDVETITIGSPKIFHYGFISRIFFHKRWKLFKQRFEKITLIEDKNDFVPRLPFSFIGFVKVAKPLFVGDKFNLFELFKPYHHHYIDSYSKNINKL